MTNNMDLAHYDDIRKWDPQVGDCIIWHGWFQHYFGIVSSVVKENGSVEVIKQGLPLLLFNMIQEDHDKNKIKVGIGEIKGSKGGKYAIVRSKGSNTIWYV